MREMKNSNIKNKKKINKTNLPKKRKRGKNSWFYLIVLFVAFLAVILLFIKPYIQNKFKKESISRTEILFKKEGRLSFFDKLNKQVIRTIDIEIAEDDYERALGLMYRYSMSDSIGMFFIMEKEEPQSFWMKDTYISLDIIYLNKDLEIVKIQKYTQPLSKQSVPSIEKAKYVLEVIGGFCDVFAINEGDIIQYEKQVQK